MRAVLIRSHAHALLGVRNKIELTIRDNLIGRGHLAVASEATSETTRRDFLYVATGAVGVVGVGAAVWPLIDQMNPDASVRALASIEFDLAPVGVGESLTITWRGQPIFVRHRTEAEIAEAQAVPMEDLKDPETDLERVVDGKEQWLIMIGICTHLGCVPLGQKPSDAKGEYNGWFCPCHGSHYDIAGRIRKGPAPKNMVLPPIEFLSDTIVKVG